MPVGTQGTVKGLTQHALEEFGVSNTSGQYLPSYICVPDTNEFASWRAAWIYGLAAARF